MKASIFALLFVLLALHRTHGASANLQWDANTEPDVAGYRIYYRASSGVYGTPVDVGNNTAATIPNLVAGQTYFFVATAYNTAGLESTPSNEVSFTAPGTTNQPPNVALTGPIGGSQFVAPATITLSANATDSDGSIARVEFFNGATKIGEDATSPFAFTWSNVPSGTFQLTAVAWDNLGASRTSAPASISVANPNQPPAVALTSPIANGGYTAPATILFSANASDSDGTIQRVEFFSNGVKLGEKTVAPFELTSTGFAAGTYTITAVAWDDRVASTTSQSVSILVNAPPTVSLATNNTTFVAPATITLTATAADTDGTIARIEFYNGATKLGEKTSAPYSWSMTSVPAGTYQLHALAVDNRGAASSSNDVQVTVVPANQLPTVSLSNPTAGALFTAPATIDVGAIANDADGSIARVEFFSGATKIGEDATSPFAFTWSNVPSGTFQLTAVAWDNLGASRTSAPVSISVANPNQPPAVTLTSPIANAGYTAPATILISANASDADGSVQRVEFFSDSVKLGEKTVAPFELTSTGFAPGTYAITAVAWDDRGTSATSQSVSILVNAPPTVSLATNNTTFVAPATITLDATASDADGTIARIEFYNGATKLGEKTAAPYSWTMTPVPAGTYQLHALAVDNRGAASSSNDVQVTVVPANQLPTVSLSSPTAGALFTTPATIDVGAIANDADGSIARVEFFSGATKIGEDATSPFVFTWSNVPSGTFQLTAVAWDNLGASRTSAPVSISVANPNQAPAVALTSPIANASYTAPAAIVFSANASDSDGSVQRVEFFSNSVKIGERTAAPFEMTSNGFPPGAYTIAAVAWDDRGTSATSQSVSILVNAPPTVSLATNNTTFVAPATITLDATASDADGTIARIEFYNGATKLGEKTAAPYSWSMTSVPAGTYQLRALAVDNRGAASSSNDVQVTVAASNQLPTVSLSSPKSGALFTAPATMSIVAAASDPDGSIARVEFFADSTLLGTSTSSPFSIEWANVGSGTYRLTAVAYDNLGGSITSAAVKISVNAPPSVSVSVNSSITSGSTNLVINAIASDPDGSVRRVEFYSGSVLLGKDMNSPYQFVWKNAPAGARDISAVAYDNSGASTRSTLIATTVEGEPQSTTNSGVLPKVQPIGRSYDDTFELSISGQIGEIYDVWYSEDLATWNLLVSVLNAEGTVIVSDYSANLDGSRFYRVSQQ